MWRKHRGPIPKGNDIHHVNGDVFDNRLENLECLTRKDHFAKHPHHRKPPDSAYEAAAAWHRSEEGRAWHREHVHESLHYDFGMRKCEQCGDEFHAKVSHARFCSAKCKTMARRARGVDDVDFTCPVCNQTVKRNRYSKAKTCSQRCGWELRRA